jgi:hypothetical protein
MLKLTADSQVLQSLKKAMPKTNKAELALEKYVSVLTAHLDQSLLYMEDNRHRFFKQYVVSIEHLMLESGQFVINGKKQYLHTWLSDNQLNLIKVVTKGLVGQEHSTINLTELVSVEDKLDLKKLGKQEINQIDQWLNDKSLSDEDFIEKVFPDIYSYLDLKQYYDAVPVDIVSLQRYIKWLIKKSEHFNTVEKQKTLRHAHLILRVAQISDGLFPQKKNPSFFGRNYYHGISIQSVHKSLREAVLGDCYEYDLRSAAASWKLGFADDLLFNKGLGKTLENDFGASIFYLQDKKAFTDYVITETFTGMNLAQEYKEDIIKKALTALSFGARLKGSGWLDQNGKPMETALVKIIQNKEQRENFVNCDLIQDLMDEQRRLDGYIFDLFTTEICPDLLREPLLQTKHGRRSQSKIMAWLFQHAETHVMNLIAAEIGKTNNEVLARVHDAIFVRHKISEYDKEKLERLICKKTNIPYWRLKEEQIKRYVGVSDETLQDEQLHREHIAAETELAKDYVGQFNQTT